MTSLVYVPVDLAQALLLRAGTGLGELSGCAPTTRLAGSLEHAAVAEEVEFVALSHAGVLAVSSGSDPLRLVLAADVADGQVTVRGSELGEVMVAGLRWAQVQALFADEPAAESSVARARADTAELGLAEALAMEAVTALQSEFDLLWFAPDELDQLARGQR